MKDCKGCAKRRAKLKEVADKVIYAILGNKQWEIDMQELAKSDIEDKDAKVLPPHAQDNITPAMARQAVKNLSNKNK